MRVDLKKPFFSIIVIVFLGTLIYSNTFFSFFHFDDFVSITDNFAIRNIYPQHIWDFIPRHFLVNYTFALNYHFHQLNVFGYHLVNLIIHLLSGILVWWLVRLTFSTPAMKEEKITSQTDLIALLAGLVFVSHPLQTEAVTYIVQRSASMATLFYLLSICLYVKSRLAQSNSQVWKRYYIESLIIATLAMFIKEIAITISLTVCLYEVCFLKTRKNLNWFPLIPFFLTILIIPITMLFTETSPEKLGHLRSEPGISSLDYLLTQFRVIVTYIRLLFLPLHQNLDYDYHISQSLFELPTLISFLFLIGIFLWTKRFLFPKYRLLVFSLLWFFITLMPESSILPIKDVIFEHRLYLPLVGYSIFLVSGAYYLLGKKNIKIMLMVLGLIIACNSILTYQRNKIWKNEVTLWEDAVQKSPHKARTYNNLGQAYYKQGDFNKALLNLNKAIEIDPQYAEAYINRGDIYNDEGNYKQAIVDFNKAIEIHPNASAAYLNRGNAYKKLKQSFKALSDYNKAIKIKSDNAMFYYNRGIFYDEQGSVIPALSDYNKAIELYSNYSEAYNNRGIIYFNQGNVRQAMSDFNMVIKIDPKNAEAYTNRGGMYFKEGNIIKALSDFNKALEINPHYTSALNNRNFLYKIVGHMASSAR